MKKRIKQILSTAIVALLYCFFFFEAPCGSGYVKVKKPQHMAFEKSAKSVIILHENRGNSMMFNKRKNYISETAINNIPYSLFMMSEFHLYDDMKNESGKLNEEAENNFAIAEDLKRSAISYSRLSQQLLVKSDSVYDKKEKYAMLKRAENSDRLFIKLMAQSDSIREMARNSEAAAFSKRIEAELYAQSLKGNIYDMILAYYDQMNPEIYETMAVVEDHEPWMKEWK